MTDSTCPDCGTPGKKVDWRPFAGLLEEYVFVCNNLACVRARLPWSVFVPRKAAS